MTILSITLKDPDGVDESIREAAREQVAGMEGLNEVERDFLVESRIGALREASKKFLEYGEYATITIDTDAGTATVKEVK